VTAGPLDANGFSLTREDGVVTLTLSRPERKNAVTADGWKTLLDIVSSLPEPGDRVLVVTGAGGDFCAGADLSAVGARTMTPLESMRIVGDACLALHRLALPTVARVDGVAVGAGCNLALVCDLVVATERSRFSEIFVKRGLSLDFGGSWLLPRLVGLSKAKELALLGDIIPAPQAKELGLVHRLVADVDALDKEVDGIVQQLRNGPPVAIAGSKGLLNNAFNVTLQQALDDEARVQAINLGLNDAKEAAMAFMEKRTPVFEGR
jgi:2-(1,2-epoxy-1,2-dihydrophenyl)acetyl-CoA isomerase